MAFPTCISCNWNLYNVVILGLSFMFLFTSFQTCSMIQTTVIEGAKVNSSFTGDGYTSLAIIYGVFASFNWAAPSVVAVCGTKISMFLGALCYAVFIASFLKPMTWALYTGSVLVGIGAAVIWTAQGSFLTNNSNKDTMGRNTGIFWALFQCSLLYGNLYIYFAFDKEVIISASTRTQLFSGLTAMAVVGTLMLLFLRRTSPPDTGQLGEGAEGSSTEKVPDGPWLAFKKSLRLMCTREMALLSVPFAYTGFELTFWSGVFGTSAGHTQQFGEEAKRMLGLCGMFIGVGEILGGALFGVLGKKTNTYGRDPIVLLGYIVHMAAFYLTWINLPIDAPLHETMRQTFIQPNKYLVVVCAFLLGLGDSSFNTQIYSLLGSLYPDNSAPAFALFKFIQSVASAAGFLYSLELTLRWQLAIMVITGTVGTLCFFLVEWAAASQPPPGYSPLRSHPSDSDVSEDTEQLPSTNIQS